MNLKPKLKWIWGVLICGVVVVALTIVEGFFVPHIYRVESRQDEKLEKILANQEEILDKVVGVIEKYRQYSIFQQALTEIGKRKYSENYDCYDHTKDLQQALRELDIESSIFVNQNRDHAWLGVWIESTKGQFIGVDNPFKLLEIRDENLNVICDCSKNITEGIGSWYDYDLPGFPDYSKDNFTCASRDYPRGTSLVVEEVDNGRLVECKINDYGPEEWTGRVIDLSSLAFKQLAPLSKGLIKVKVSVAN